MHDPLPRRRLGALVAMTALVAAMAGTTVAIGSEEPVQPVGREDDGWVLRWSDEFEGPAGSPPDPEVWGYDLGDGAAKGLTGWGNSELQWYTDDPQNVALDGEGNLVISALESDDSLECFYGPCLFTSARLLTQDRFEFQHGFLEARILVPHGAGLWPAFWMLGSNIDEVDWPASGEIDVMEYVGRLPTEVLGTVHGPGYAGGAGLSGRIDLGQPVADAFHTMALEWEPGRLAWFLDGTPYHEVTSEQVGQNEWVFEQPFFMLLNVAVGGTLGGLVLPDTEFPARMAVDYVRLYEQGSA